MFITHYKQLMTWCKVFAEGGSNRVRVAWRVLHGAGARGRMSHSPTTLYIHKEVDRFWIPSPSNVNVYKKTHVSGVLSKNIRKVMQGLENDEGLKMPFTSIPIEHMYIVGNEWGWAKMALGWEVPGHSGH